MRQTKREDEEEQARVEWACTNLLRCTDRWERESAIEGNAHLPASPPPLMGNFPFCSRHENETLSIPSKKLYIERGLLSKKSSGRAAKAEL